MAHRKYIPPAPLEAPPDLAALVAAHLACPPGRKSDRTLLLIHAWGFKRRVKLYQTYITDDVVVTFSDSLPRIGKIADSNWFKTRKLPNQR